MPSSFTCSHHITRLCLAVLLASTIVSTSNGQTRGKTAVLTIAGHRLPTEVMATPEQRAKGMMFRQTMAENEGMLFVFPAAQKHCMWMKNTLIALDVAFMDAGGQILNVESMSPMTENSHCAVAEAQFALETPQGWFARKRIKNGARVLGLPSAVVTQ